VSLIVTGLLTWVGTSLSATGSFQNERNVEYGATAAVNLAVQNTRYTFDSGSPQLFLNNPAPEQCASYPIPNQTSTVHVYCTLVWQPYSSNTRVFTYSACISNTPNDRSPADCAAKPVLQARFAFYDYASGGASISQSPPQCQPINPNNGSCGENMTELSWQWSPLVPAVSSISPATGPISGGTTVTIQGTGFTGGESVNFVQTDPSTGTYNPSVPATIVANPAPGCALPTCIQVTSPVVTSGTTYYVTVTTPGGTSQTTTSDYNPSVPTFTYNPVQPTVTGLVGTTSGTITGGDTVTIQGTGFWNAANNPQIPAQVSFCPTVGGSCTFGSVITVTPPPNGSTTSTMTALTPAVSASGTYYVQVESYNLSSPLTANAEFTYTVHVPIVISLSTQPASSPASGGAGTTLTITGANFLTGSTVGFCPTAQYNSGTSLCSVGLTAATVVPPVAPTQISVTVPTMTDGTYYPIVTLPSGYLTSPFNASQAYNQPADTFTYTG
jgi:hypothetical protein